MYEILLGSSNVWLEGQRAARLAVDVTKHCTFSSPKPAKPQDPPLGNFFGFTISASSNVAIGGIPMPSLTAKAMAYGLKKLFQGLGKLIARLRAARAAAKAAQVAEETVRAGAGNNGINYLGKPLTGPVSGRFSPHLADGERVLGFLRDVKAAGGRLVLPPGSHISVNEMAALTEATGKEWGAAVNKEGRLVLIRGTAEEVGFHASDTPLAHTHTDLPSGKPSTSISCQDLELADGVNRRKQWPHDQAMINQQGDVYHFNQNGVRGDPPLSPIDRDGNITGVMSSPRGAPVRQVPGNFNNFPTGGGSP
jgi:hypothetical protein